MPAAAHHIETGRLLLRPFVEKDFAALHEIERREDVHRYLYSTPHSEDDTRASLQRRMERSAIDGEHDDLNLAAERRDSGELIGHFVLRRTSREHLQGEIGFVLHPDHQGHGFATEGAAAMLRNGFEEVGLHRIEGRCDARNRSSKAVMERLGMRLEAHLRENELFKGEWGDELVYAILDREWAARAEASPRPVGE